IIMNAGASGEGRAFALRNCDAWFTTVRFETVLQASMEDASQVILDAKAEARSHGNEVEAYTVGTIICRPTRREAQEFHHYVADEMADWDAVDNILAMRDTSKLTPEQYQQ